MRTQQIEEDGKIVGLRTEMRQRLTELDGKIVGQQTEMRQRFTQIETTQQEHTATLAEQKNLLTEILSRLPEK